MANSFKRLVRSVSLMGDSCEALQQFDINKVASPLIERDVACHSAVLLSCVTLFDSKKTFSSCSHNHCMHDTFFTDLGSKST